MCPAGYKLGEDWKTCEDVDECATMASVREEECGGAELCKNTEGKKMRQLNKQCQLHMNFPNLIH